MQPEQTQVLLQRWHAGDREALDELLQRDLPWVTAYVQKRLGPALLARADAGDYVQEAMVEILQYAPRFVVADRIRFRALVARMVKNSLRDRYEWYRARRRDMNRDCAVPDDSALQLDPAARSATRPSQAAARSEEQNWVRLGLELLEPDDRRMVVLRQWDGLAFAEIGAQLGIQEDTARMRFNTAVRRLAGKIAELRSGSAGDEDGEP